VHRKIAIAVGTALLFVSVLCGQSGPGPLAEELARRLSSELHVKTVVGEPVKVGSVTLVPIVMVDISFGGAGLVAPTAAVAPAAAASASKGASADARQNPPAPADGFYMSGEARPLGFVVITKQGTRFISLAAAPAK
jgi:uncharacterized spore protein YtfJ